jgi:hypothetical protein
MELGLIQSLKFPNGFGDYLLKLLGFIKSENALMEELITFQITKII